MGLAKAIHLLGGSDGDVKKKSRYCSLGIYESTHMYRKNATIVNAGLGIQRVQIQDFGAFPITYKAYDLRSACVLR